MSVNANALKPLVIPDDILVRLKERGFTECFCYHSDKDRVYFMGEGKKFLGSRVIPQLYEQMVPMTPYKIPYTVGAQ